MTSDLIYKIEIKSNQKNYVTKVKNFYGFSGCKFSDLGWIVSAQKEGLINMKDEAMEKAHQNQIENHRKNETKKHQYPIRLTDDTYQKLKQIACDGPISDVINRGIETEWIYYRSFEQFAKEMPHFDSVEAIEKWRLDTLKDSPELMARYIQPAAILEYVKQLTLDVKSRELLADNQATIAYLIRNIGNNINQLARRANQGGNVDKDALAQLTHAVIQLDETIRSTTKEAS